MRLTGLTLPILLGALLIQVVTVVIKRGECPKSQTHYFTCSLLPKMENGNCTGDQDCYGTQKCCLYNCQYQCKYPIVRKPGECPKSPTPPTSCSLLPKMEDGNCTGDQDCKWSQKCCLYNCQYQCEDPVGLRDPLLGNCCSSLLSSIFKSVYFLRKLTVCPECLQRCLKNIEVIWNDECCNGTQNSCLDDCNYLCTEPKVIKPGVCPFSPTPPTSCSLLPEMEDGNCTGDQHCYGTQKCCLYDCQYQCKDPAVTKPGECRAHYIDPDACFPAVPQEGCRSDQECDGAKKCCLYDCHYACRDPVE